MWDMYVEINQPWSVAGPSRGSKFRASNPAVHLANASAHGKHSMPFTVVLFDPRKLIPAPHSAAVSGKSSVRVFVLYHLSQ